MSRQAWLSLAGLYNYDKTVLDGFRVPEGMSLETAKKKLLLDTIELEFLYPEPETAKEAITLWTDEEFSIWQKLYNTTILEYNPIWNVDGTTKEIENRGLQRGGKENRGLQRNGTETRDLENSHNLTENIENETDTDGTETEAVTGYNSSDWANHTKNTIDNTEVGSSERGLTEAGTDTGTIDREDQETENITKEDQEEENITRETVRQGNIGVTSTQQLIKEERESVMFNVYQEIVNSFKKRFCLCVY